ncbi:MAG TPA: HupE/UreJ family protein [Polyangia bacterium]|nr:HupE/UreJ family protein [Polyangia bacterium]
MSRSSARSTRRLRACLLASAALLLSAPAAESHQIDTATLSLNEVAPGRFLVSWLAASRTLQDDLGAAVVFPPSCRLSGQALACGGTGLTGSIAFPWIEGTMTRVVVDVQWRDGTRLLRMATPTSPSLKVYGTAGSGWRALAPIAADYVALGVEHILTGFDHLLFVVALTLLVRRKKQLLATITAFTIAHSISLALTVLDVVRLPSPPVEASIALSIVLVCAECLRPGDSLAHRAPWAVAFAFGLLHGLGFASALLELGVPEQHVPTALLCFNVGVELGQLGIIAAVLAARALVARLRIARPWMRPGLVYAMGGLAAYWTIDRLGAVFGL